MVDLVRLHYKPSGSNPEIQGPFYETLGYFRAWGAWNMKMLSLDFKFGESERRQLVFRPVDADWPIVLAVSNVDHAGFVVIDEHLRENAGLQTRNYSAYKYSFLTDCRVERDEKFFAVTAGGATYVFGRAFPDTFAIDDCDLLCGLIGGGVTFSQLRAHAYRVQIEAKKEARREDLIKELKKQLRMSIERNEQLCQGVELAGMLATRCVVADGRLRIAQNRLLALLDSLRCVSEGWLPFGTKYRLRKILKIYEKEPSPPSTESAYEL